ncbi:MAG TPA: glycosyltransferase family 2 protein, partial [Candidatus Angelobacter sp.]|nr:glycosyltransferase family 2 protein [Candidatus Angelobacter sp.]
MIKERKSVPKTERMANTTAVRVSIIIACRNEIWHICDCLESLLSQDMNGIAWEAIIADGMSDDGTHEILGDYSLRYPQLRVIENPGRIVSTGLNAAIRAARGEIIIRMDAHTCYAPSYCWHCVATLEHTGADNVGGPARTQAAGLRARAFAAAFHSRFSTGGARFHDDCYEGWVDTVPYGCWRKQTLVRLGLFDESLVRNQDDELNLRLLRAGGKIWQSPEIASWYSPRATLSGVFRQYFQYGFWKFAVIRKHRTPSSWRHIVPAVFVAANILLLAGSAITAALSASRCFATLTILWLVLLFAYAAASLTASVIATGRCGWAMLAYLPGIFAAYHLSYGL